MNKLKNYTAIGVVVLFTKVCVAQTGIVVGINGFGYKSNLYNHYDFKADKSLDYVRSYGTSFGVEIGYQLEKAYIISINPKTSKVNQDYIGKSLDAFGDEYKTTINSNLSYLSIPLTLQKTYGEGKLKFNLSGGIQYWKLLKYREFYSRDYTSEPQYGFTRIIEKDQYEFYKNITASNPHAKATMNKYLYKKNNFGLNVGAGTSFPITNNFQVYVKLNAEYSLFDIEYKDTIMLKANDIGSSWLTGSFLPLGIAQKYTPVSNLNADKRENTHIFNLGLMLGLRFIIPQ